MSNLLTRWNQYLVSDLLFFWPLWAPVLLIGATAQSNPSQDRALLIFHTVMRPTAPTIRRFILTRITIYFRFSTTKGRRMIFIVMASRIALILQISNPALP